MLTQTKEIKFTHKQLGELKLELPFSHFEAYEEGLSAIGGEDKGLVVLNWAQATQSVRNGRAALTAFSVDGKTPDGKAIVLANIEEVYSEQQIAVFRTKAMEEAINASKTTVAVGFQRGTGNAAALNDFMSLLKASQAGEVSEVETMEQLRQLASKYNVSTEVEEVEEAA